MGNFNLIVKCENRKRGKATLSHPGWCEAELRDMFIYDLSLRFKGRFSCNPWGDGNTCKRRKAELPAIVNLVLLT